MQCVCSLLDKHTDPAMPRITTHSSTLSNGLRVVTCPVPESSLVTVHVQYRVGSYHEDPSKTGLAHLFEHLMFDNTSTGIEKHYDLLCTRAGGTNNAYTTYDHTAYHITLPAHQLDLGLWLEAERMQAFTVSEQALRVQQSVVVEEIKQNVENQPYGRVWETIDHTAFTPDSHYSWNVYGSPQHVEAVTMSDAQDFFNTFYQPRNAIVVVTGDCDLTTAQTMIERRFGSIPSAQIPQHPHPQVSTTVGQHQIVTDRVPAAAVFLTLPLPPQTDERVLDAEILARIIGGGTSSVLHHHLVHTKRIASYAGAFVDRRSQASLLMIYAYGLDETITADDLVTEIHIALANTKLDQATTTKAINQLRTAQAIELQKGSSIANEIAYYAMYFEHPELINTVLDSYTSRTHHDLLAAFDRMRNAALWNRIDILPG